MTTATTEPKPPVVRVVFEAREDLMQRLDAEAERLMLSRADCLRQAVRHWLGLLKQSQPTGEITR